MCQVLAINLLSIASIYQSNISVYYCSNNMHDTNAEKKPHLSYLKYEQNNLECGEEYDSMTLTHLVTINNNSQTKTWI